MVILAGLSSATRLTWKTIGKSLMESSMKSLEFGEKASKHDSVRVAFDISYRYLKRKAPNATGVFMKTGLFARPKGQLSALQNVSNLNESLFQSAMDTLVHANLIRIGSDSNYSEGWSTHTLLRDYAEELRLRKDFRRAAAEKRYVDYYEKIALGFEDQFNQGIIHPLEFADAVPEICHAIEIAVNRNWVKEAVWLIRSSISPMIAFGQFSSLEFLEMIMEKETEYSSRERVVLEGGLAKIKLWHNDHHGAIQLLEKVISAEFPTESINAARTLAQVYLDEGKIETSEKYLDLAHSILKELPPGYPYPTKELWAQYYEGMGNYYLHTSQARLAYDAFTHAREFAVEHVGWTNHITNLIARCLLALGDFDQTLTLLSSFPEDNNAEFSLHSVERNLIRAECYWRIGNIEQAKKNLRSTEAMLHGVLDQPGLESYLATLNRLHNLIDQDKSVGYA